jgi:hypothetical protein
MIFNEYFFEDVDEQLNSDKIIYFFFRDDMIESVNNSVIDFFDFPDYFPTQETLEFSDNLEVDDLKEQLKNKGSENKSLQENMNELE